MTIELKDVCLNAEPAWNPLSLCAEEGKVTSIVAPAGTGKTRLALAILGLAPIASGCISYDGALLTPKSAPFLRQYTAYVPQQLPPDIDSATTILRDVAPRQKPVVIVDAPSFHSPEETTEAVKLLRQMESDGATIVLFCQPNHPLLQQLPSVSHSITTRK